MPGKHKTSQGSGRSPSSSQAKGAQGWKQINYTAGTEVAPKAEKKATASKPKAASKKPSRTTPARTTRRKKPADEKPAEQPTRDALIIKWMLNWPGHIKQGVAATVLLLFTILLTVGLLIRLHSQSPLATLGEAFHQLFGWGTMLLVIGLIALAIANLAEAATRVSIVRLALVMQMVILGCLLLVESRLLFGGDTGQLLGALLASPLAGFPSLAQQIIVVGGIIIVLLLVFHISWSQMLLALRWLFGGISHALRATFGALGVAMGEARARRAANRLARAAQPEEEDEEESLSALTTTSGSKPFPRLRRRAEGAVIVEDDDEDLASLALQLEEAVVAAVPARARQSGQQALPGPAPRTTSRPLPGGSASLGDIPPLPPLPMKAKAAAKKQATGPLPVVGTPVHYELPAITLLNGVVEQRQLRQEDTAEELARKVERTLRSFRVDAEVRRSDISVGPTVIRVGIRPIERVKKDYRGHIVLDDDGEPLMVRTRVSRIMALQNDLALDLEAKTIRMEAPVPGRPYVGVEIPNKQSRLVTLREILASKDYEESRRKSKLTVALGRDVAGRARIGDLSRFPHLLIAGATGAGKSVCLNSIIACLLMQATPQDVRFLMVDPKMVELTGFNGIPHLLSPVVTEVEQVIGTLKRGIIEMERRYRLFSKLGVRNLEAYRKLCAQRPELENLPNIVIIIDELADLMMSAPEDVESLICRLAQLARATGIHLVVATQRPSVDVITGLIKANFPTRISFMVSSAVDSRTILDMGGAERLLGKGDMLYLPIDAGKPERIQGTFLADDELERIVEHWRQTQPTVAHPEPTWEPVADEDDAPEDDLLPQAEQIVREAGKATLSLLQRRLSVGHHRAGRLIDLLEARGVIGPDAGSRPREVLAPEQGIVNAPSAGSPASSTGKSEARDSVTGGQSGTMPPGNTRGFLSPNASINQTPPQAPSGPHASGRAPAQPGTRKSGTARAREADEDVEELEL